MPYTRPWTIAAPLGTVQAKDIDLLFRQHNEDIEERLESVLVTDMALDPLVLKDDVKGKFVGKKLLIHPVGIIEGTLTVGVSGDYKVRSGPMYLPIPLAPRNTITKIEALVERMAGSPTILRLYGQAFTSGGVPRIMLHEHTSATPGKYIATLDINFLLEDATMYYVYVESSGSNSMRWYGTRITYDSPDNGATV
jgi:hypothetical protein